MALVLLGHGQVILILHLLEKMVALHIVLVFIIQQLGINNALVVHIIVSLFVGNKNYR